MNALQLFADVTSNKVTINTKDVGIPGIAANGVTLTAILSAVFIALGGVSLLFVVLGAFRYTISNGDPKQISQAKDTILYALIGAIVSALAFTIVQFILGQVIG